MGKKNVCFSQIVRVYKWIAERFLEVPGHYTQSVHSNSDLLRLHLSGTLNTSEPERRAITGLVAGFDEDRSGGAPSSPES